jgi:hypothetical protein
MRTPKPTKLRRSQTKKRKKIRKLRKRTKLQRPKRKMPQQKKQHLLLTFLQSSLVPPSKSEWMSLASKTQFTPEFDYYYLYSN